MDCQRDCHSTVPDSCLGWGGELDTGINLRARMILWRRQIQFLRAVHGAPGPRKSPPCSGALTEEESNQSTQHRRTQGYPLAVLGSCLEWLFLRAWRGQVSNPRPPRPPRVARARARV